MIYTKNIRTNIGYLMSNKGGEYEQSRSWNPWGCTHTHTHTLCLLKNNEIKKLYIKYKYMRINLKYKLYMVGFLCPPILY